MPCFLPLPLIKLEKHYALNWLIASLFVLFGQSQASIVLKSVGNNTVVKKKDSN